MKKQRLIALLLSLSFVGLLSFCGLHIRQQDRQSAIDTSLQWARLSSLPESAEDIDVLVEGSMFTREFEITFQADKEEIEAWLTDSPGTAFLPRDSSTEDTVVYSVLEPNAEFAQVKVDWETLTVVIHTYWS